MTARPEIAQLLADISPDGFWHSDGTEFSPWEMRLLVHEANDEEIDAVYPGFLSGPLAHEPRAQWLLWALWFLRPLTRPLMWGCDACPHCGESHMGHATTADEAMGPQVADCGLGLVQPTMVL